MHGESFTLYWRCSAIECTTSSRTTESSCWVICTVSLLYPRPIKTSYICGNVNTHTSKILTVSHYAILLIYCCWLGGVRVRADIRFETTARRHAASRTATWSPPVPVAQRESGIGAPAPGVKPRPRPSWPSARAVSMPPSGTVIRTYGPPLWAHRSERADSRSQPKPFEWTWHVHCQKETTSTEQRSRTSYLPAHYWENNRHGGRTIKW